MIYCIVVMTLCYSIRLLGSSVVWGGVLSKIRRRPPPEVGFKLPDSVLEFNPLNALGQTVWTGDLPPLVPG